MQRLVCRIPVDQTEAAAQTIGYLIVKGLEGKTFQMWTRALILSDATRDAVVLYVNAASGSKMKGKELLAIDGIPIRLDNRMRFGDVIAEDD